MAETAMSGVELDDIQGLLRWGFGRHTEAVFLLLRVKEAAAARQWLRRLEPASSVSLGSVSLGSVPNTLPDTLLQVALTSDGMRALGVRPDIINGFSEEFLEGMTGDTNRTRRLGDIGASAHDRWVWGSGDRVPHVAVLLYARPGCLESFQRSIETQCGAGFDVLYRLSTARRSDYEPFGFRDGISQPEIDWDRTIPAADRQQLTYGNLSCLGEFILGYPNEYGLYTPRPQLGASVDPAGVLPRSEENPGQVDIGRNGSYLVIRQLRQDVPGFWQAMDTRAGGIAAERQRLASLLVGRTLDGSPVVLGRDVNTGAVASNTGAVASNAGSAPSNAGAASSNSSAAPSNDFTFDSDREGHLCPIGAHIRRANPRTADLPPGSIGVVSELVRILGLDSSARARDLAASTRFHRLLRRGRKYGAQLTPEQALSAPATQESGLQFVCLNANLQRQFEFVQSAWLMGTHFDGLHGESDPLVGNRVPRASGTPCAYFSMPQAAGPTQRLEDLPQFVTVAGGAYFFLPGIRALRFMTAEPA